MESRTSAGSVCETGFFGGKTACFDGNAAVRNHRRRQLGVDGDDADGGCGARGHNLSVVLLIGMDQSIC